jgi:pimeloyl-ACP methyl ester carboxylesterase
MRADIDGVTLHYELTGDGPATIALLHGIGGSGDDFAPLAPLLAERFRVLAWDARGFGRSARPAEGYTIARFARDLAGLLDHLGVDKAVIMGTSMGGTIAQRFILDFPERTLAAVIMSTSSEVNERGRQRWFDQADAIEREGMAAWVRRSRPPEQTQEYLQAHPELLEAEERRIANNPDGRVYAQVARAVADYNYTEELKGVRVPTLVLVGGEDKQTPPGGSVIISRTIPGAELHILPGYGHSLAREAPEEVAALVTAFLDRILEPAAR